MALKDITAGEKIGKVLGARFIEAGENNSLGMEISFSFEEPTVGSQESLSKVFWLTSAAIKKSMEDLCEVLNFNGNDEIDAEGNLTDKGAFTDGQIKLVIEMEEHEGKMYPKIKWVNKLGGSGFSGVAVETLKNKLQAVGFKALYMSSKGGKKTPQSSTSDSSDWGKGAETKTTPPADQASYDPDDIPF